MFLALFQIYLNGYIHGSEEEALRLVISFSSFHFTPPTLLSVCLLLSFHGFASYGIFPFTLLFNSFFFSCPVVSFTFLLFPVALEEETIASLIFHLGHFVCSLCSSCFVIMFVSPEKSFISFMRWFLLPSASCSRPQLPPVLLLRLLLSRLPRLPLRS